MPNSGPSCAIPSCASEPTVGFGSAGFRRHGILGHSGIGYGALGSGGSELAISLGIAPGANVSYINQTPPSEIVVQPPPFAVIIPGPTLSASCEPVAMGGTTPCAVEGVGIAGGFGHSGFGFGRYGFGLGNKGFLGQRGGCSIRCLSSYCQ